MFKWLEFYFNIISKKMFEVISSWTEQKLRSILKCNKIQNNKIKPTVFHILNCVTQTLKKRLHYTIIFDSEYCYMFAIIAFIWGEHRKLSTQGWLFSPWALDRGKTTSRQLTTWCSSHMKAITVLLYRNYSKMFITWIFCVGEDNNRKCKYGNGLGKTYFQHTSGCKVL